MSEEAYIKAMLKVQREVIGFEPTKIFKNKKKYNRTTKHKTDNTQED